MFGNNPLTFCRLLPELRSLSSLRPLFIALLLAGALSFRDWRKGQFSTGLTTRKSVVSQCLARRGDEAATVKL